MTSIEWLISRLAINDILDHKKLSEDKRMYNLYLRLKAQAEEMHREEVIIAYDDGTLSDMQYPDPDTIVKNGEQYYTKTFKKN
jgi:hypothetical protein